MAENQNCQTFSVNDSQAYFKKICPTVLVLIRAHRQTDRQTDKLTLQPRHCFYTAKEHMNTMCSTPPYMPSKMRSLMWE
jgi:hypothetical protein